MSATTNWAPQATRVAWQHVIGVLAAIALVVSVAALADTLLVTAAVLAAALFTIVSLRWPLIPLFALAAVIPIDEIARIGPLGSPGRIAAIFFLVFYGLPRLSRIRVGAMPLAAWAYVGWAVLSIGWSLDPHRTVMELGTLVQLFALAVLAAHAATEKPALVWPLLFVYSLSAALTASVGIAANLVGGRGDIQRVAAFSGQDPAQFAAIMLPAFFVGVYALRQRRERLLAGFIAFATFAGIVLSGSRGAWVSLVAVTALFVLRGLQWRQRGVVIGVGVVALLVLLQVPGVAQFVTTRTDSAITTGGAGRTDIWSVGFGIFQSSPVVSGVGFANFPVAFTAERIREAGVGNPVEIGSGPHNIVLSTLVELGVVGLALLAILIVPLLLRRDMGRDAEVIRAALASLMVDALFLDLLGNRKQVWLLIGLAAGLAWIGRGEHRLAPLALEPAPGVARAVRRYARSTDTPGVPAGETQ